MRMSKPLLITLLPSSGVDAGRWILSHYGVDYTERPHAPIFHILALKAWGMGKDDYPLLVQGDVKTHGARHIMSLFDADAPADKRLMPDEKAMQDEIMELAGFTAGTLGDAVVNWSYFHLLKHKAAVWPSVTTDVPWYEKATLAVGFPVIRWLMYKGLGLTDEVADTSLQTLRDGFDTLDQRLSDGRRYLVGDTLTFADVITAACLGPMVLAQGYHGMLPNQSLCPVFMQKVYAEMRARPTGQYIQRMYDEHRAAQLLQV